MTSLKNPHFIINIPNLQNKSCIFEASEIPNVNISFHSLAGQDRKDFNSENFSKKWVLNKLIEMQCEKAEEIIKKIPDIPQVNQSKEELLSVCLDNLTNSSVSYSHIEKKKHLTEQTNEECKKFIRDSIPDYERNDKQLTTTQEFYSKSVDLNEERKKTQANQNKSFDNKTNVLEKIDIQTIEPKKRNFEQNFKIEREKRTKYMSKSLIILKKKENESELSFLEKNQVFDNLILFSENSIIEQSKNNDVLKLKLVPKLLKTHSSPNAIKYDINKTNQKKHSSNCSLDNISKIQTPEKSLDIKNELEKMSPYPFASRNIFQRALSSTFSNKGENLMGEKKTLDQEIEIEENLKSCEICLDVLPKSKQLKAGKCGDTFCKNCIKSHLIENITSGKVFQIPCPKEGCKHKYTDEEIKKVLKKQLEIIKKYEKYKMQILLSKDPAVRWCIRPDCDNVLKGSSDKPKLICPCGEIVCFNCSKQWHEGKTCIELMDLEYEDYRLKNNVITCSKCNSRIEKISGCNHMTCTRCSYEFCWICGGKYTKRHFKKLNIFGCPGMLYQNFKRDKNLKKKLYQIKLLTFLKVIGFFILFLLFPLIGVFLLIGVPNFLYFHDRRKKCNCKNFCLFLLLSIVGIIILPLTLILAIVPGTCIFLYQVRKEF